MLKWIYYQQIQLPESKKDCALEDTNRVLDEIWI